MKTLFVLLLVTVSFANDVYINGDVINSTININMNDTSTEGHVKARSILRPSKEYLVATIGLQYMFPFDGRDIVVSDKGLGLRLNLMLHSPMYKGVIGMRVGHTRHDNLMVTKNNNYEPTGYYEIDQYYEMETELPYRSTEISVIAGGYRIQGFFGWGYFVNESSAVVGINLQTYGRVGLSSSFSVMFNDKKYAPELGVGVTFSL